VNVALPPTLPPPQPGLSANAVANAYASADPRFNAKPLDRPGLSRGRGTYAQAGINAGQSFVRGIADAYGQEAEDATTAEGQRLNAMAGQERYANALGGLATQAAYAQQLNQLQGLGALASLLGTRS
jgi:hypothetical protein